uniref:PCNA-associated factor n=1 Tax=Salvator merianae TaxID=96440 RepID=A0A8D0B6S2_SALMN
MLNIKVIIKKCYIDVYPALPSSGKQGSLQDASNNACTEKKGRSVSISGLLIILIIYLFISHAIREGLRQLLPAMVRTKADCGGTGGAYRKVVAARAPRKALGSGNANMGSPSTSRKESKYAGGNPVCVRPTPPWQKGIGEFFHQSPKHSEKENQVSDEEPGCSGIGKRRRKARPLPPCSADHETSDDDHM